MAYSHSRLRKALAAVRILTGLVFVTIGLFKVSSMEFGKQIFPDFLDHAIRGGAVSGMRPVLEWIISVGPARVGVTIGFVELFIGFAMVLGLAVRPAALVGMLYSAGLFLATFNQSPATPSMLQNSEHQFRNLFPAIVFLMLGVGHAGETWGIGSLYHRHRARNWTVEDQSDTAPEAAAEPKEPANFEEYAEQERFWEEREDEMAAANPRDESGK